jgi:hypothetical protein
MTPSKSHAPTKACRNHSIHLHIEALQQNLLTILSCTIVSCCFLAAFSPVPPLSLLSSLKIRITAYLDLQNSQLARRHRSMTERHYLKTLPYCTNLTGYPLSAPFSSFHRPTVSPNHITSSPSSPNQIVLLLDCNEF